MKKFLILIFAVIIAAPVFAQTQDEKQKHREQMQALKIAHITEKAGITVAESTRFWPLYNDYWKQRREFAHRKRAVMKKMEAQPATKTELNELFDIVDAENALMRRTADQFMTVLSPDKTAKVFAAEEGFKFVILRKSGLK